MHKENDLVTKDYNLPVERDKESTVTVIPTITAQDIVDAGSQAKYDAQVKAILANKEILARILKHTVEEYRECSIEDIRDKYIEGVPCIGGIPVFPGSTNAKIIGDNTESNIVGEGTTYFDIVFNSMLPNKNRHIKINVEANKEFTPGYEIQTRGVYYGSRMLSSEYGREFEKMEYDKLVKTYSIWICTEPPEREENSIAEICFHKKDIYNTITMSRESYELIDVIIIHLNQDCHKEANYIVGMLSTLLSSTIEVDEKLQLLEEKYGIPMVEETKSEVREMCNLGEALSQKAYTRGVTDGENNGRQETILDLLGNLGNVPSGVASVIRGESDISVLRRWTNLILKVSSIEEFERRM